MVVSSLPVLSRSIAYDVVVLCTLWEKRGGKRETDLVPLSIVEFLRGVCLLVPGAASRWVRRKWFVCVCVFLPPCTRRKGPRPTWTWASFFCCKSRLTGIDPMLVPLRDEKKCYSAACGELINECQIAVSAQIFLISAMC